MIYNKTASLITQSGSVNSVGDFIVTTSATTVFCCEKSIGLKRKLEAQSSGLKLTCKLILADESEYNEQEICNYLGKNYNIVDVYKNEDNTVEITLARF